MSIAETRAEWLRNALGELTPKQRFVVECRWGLRDGIEYRFGEIAAFMGVSSHAVHRIHKRALKRLNHQGGLGNPLIGRGSIRPPALGSGLSVLTDEDREGSVCLSPLIPEHHGLTFVEADTAVRELFYGS